MCEVAESGSRPIRLSVVIIGRNEEDYIGSAIESSLATQEFLDSEVIFVDSASTDQSVEIAQRFPIQILQLRPDWPLCVAAGRFTGFEHSRGEYVFFLDGDAQLKADWVRNAVNFLDQQQDYGAVAGILDEVYTDEKGQEVKVAHNVFDQDPSEAIIGSKVLGGLALYRRKALEEAGTVNPHLPTAEDHELCIRIRNRGYKLARLPGLMAVKYTEDRQTIKEVLRRSRTRMYDYGTVLRYSRLYGAGLQYCIETIPFVVSTLVFFVLFVVSLPVCVYLGVAWLPPVIALVVVGLIAVKKGGLHDGLLSIVVRVVSTFRTLLSYASTTVKPVDDYPRDVIRVQ